MSARPQAAGKTPQQLTDEVSARIPRAVGPHGHQLRRLHPHHFSRHKAGVQALWRRIADKGYIYKGSYSGQYCVFDELYVDAIGPGAPCPECGRPTETVQEENYFFKLSAFQDKLLQLYAENPELIRPETRRNEVISFVRSGLRDLSISRSTFSWGIPVPDDPKHVIYVWLDALANYITALGYGSRRRPANLRNIWPADVHMIGKEIVRFHCVYWPAFLIAAGLPLPKGIMAHGWLLFEENKMSKSRGNIVRAETILDVLGADALRYFLLREIVFGQDGSFSFDALVQRYNADLANGLGNLASRTLTMIAGISRARYRIPRRRRTRRRMMSIAVNSRRPTIAECGQFFARVQVFRCARIDLDPAGRGCGQVHRRKRALGAGRERGRREPGAASHRALHLRGSAAHCDRAGASCDAGSNSENLDAAGLGRHPESSRWPN